jgi:hypothetical protein
MTPRTKVFAVLAIGAIAAMIALAILGRFLDANHVLDDPAVAKRTGPAAGAVFFALFLVLGFSLVPLGIRLFVVLQTRIGNGDLWLVRGLRAHDNGVTYAFWAVFALGLAVALPVMLRDLFGWRPSVGAAEGVLVARIGMPLDEMRRRSSLALSEGVVSSLTGSTTVAGSPVFDFEVADTAIRFERCRYYFIVTGDDGDPKIESMSIGVSPETFPRSELAAAHQRIQRALAADGWIAGFYAYDTPELQQLHGGMTESGRGFFWKKGDTLLHLQAKRMDDEQPGEDAVTAGQWIQFLDLRAPGSNPDLRYER